MSGRKVYDFRPRDEQGKVIPETELEKNTRYFWAKKSREYKVAVNNPDISRSAILDRIENMRRMVVDVIGADLS